MLEQREARGAGRAGIVGSRIIRKSQLWAVRWFAWVGVMIHCKERN